MTTTKATSKFDQVFEDLEAPEYPATCDQCGKVGTNASMAGHECGNDYDIEQERIKFQNELAAAMVRAGATEVELPAPRAGERERVTLNSDLVVRPMPNTLLKTKCLLATDDDWPIAEFYREEEAEGIAYEHNQHATLIEQRERLLAALREYVTDKCNCYQDAQCQNCETKVLIATIEQEGEGTR